MARPDKNHFSRLRSRALSANATDQEDIMRLAYRWAHQKYGYPLERLPDQLFFSILLEVEKLDARGVSMRGIWYRLETVVREAIRMVDEHYQTKGERRESQRRKRPPRDDGEAGLVAR